MYVGLFYYALIDTRQIHEEVVTKTHQFFFHYISCYSWFFFISSSLNPVFYVLAIALVSQLINMPVFTKSSWPHIKTSGQYFWSISWIMSLFYLDPLFSIFLLRQNFPRVVGFKLHSKDHTQYAPETEIVFTFIQPLSFQCLAQSLGQNEFPVNICKMSEWIKEVTHLLLGNGIRSRNWILDPCFLSN